MSKDKDPRTWTTEDVVNWAKANDIPAEDASKLAAKDVDGMTLLTLNETNLSEFGIITPVVRARILGCLEQLKHKHKEDFGYRTPAEINDMLVQLTSALCSELHADEARVKTIVQSIVKDSGSLYGPLKAPQVQPAQPAPNAAATAAAAAAAAAAASKPWVFPIIAREESERLLRDQGKNEAGAYLVRTKEPGKQYCLTVAVKDGFVHHLLTRNLQSGLFDVNGNQPTQPQDNLGKLVAFLKAPNNGTIPEPLTILLRPIF